MRIREVLTIKYSSAAILTGDCIVYYEANPILWGECQIVWEYFLQDLFSGINISYNILDRVLSDEASFSYSILNNNPVYGELQLRYRLTKDVSKVQQTNISSNFSSVSISTDEGGKYYTFSAKIDDINALPKIDDLIEFAGYQFVVDSISQSQTPFFSCSITGKSPLSLKERETSFIVIREGYAQTVCKNLLPGLLWQMPSWKLQQPVSGENPVAVVSAIVGEAGGLLECLPNGAPRVRLAYPKNIPAYSTPDIVLNEVISIKETNNYKALINSITVTNMQDLSVSITSESYSYSSGYIDVICYPLREISLTHTGHPDINIREPTTTYKKKIYDEYVEFRNGKGSTTQPVQSIIEYSWRMQSLGEVTANGTELTSEIAGYGLLKISYTYQTTRFVVTSCYYRTQFIVLENETPIATSVVYFESQQKEVVKAKEEEEVEEVITSIQTVILPVFNGGKTQFQGGDIVRISVFHHNLLLQTPICTLGRVLAIDRNAYYRHTENLMFLKSDTASATLTYPCIRTGRMICKWLAGLPHTNLSVDEKDGKTVRSGSNYTKGVCEVSYDTNHTLVTYESEVIPGVTEYIAGIEFPTKVEPENYGDVYTP